MTKLHLKIVTPEKEILNEEVSEVIVPSVEGELGILPGHADLMAKLKAGELIIKNGDKTSHLAIGGGFIQMIDNSLTILTDLAEHSSDIDEKKVEEARKRAEVALEQKLSGEEYAETLGILERSLAQLKVKRRTRTH